MGEDGPPGEQGPAGPPGADGSGGEGGDTDSLTAGCLQRARSLGFTVEQCRELLDLYRDRGRASADVKAIAKGRIADIRRKIAELKSMEATLAALVEHCHGDGRPDCPILDDLAGVPGDRRH
jgi:hypothetical protein